MEIQKNNTHRIAKTAAAAGVLLLVFFFQGALAVINGLEGSQSAAVRGLVIWGFTLITAVLFYIKHKTLKLLGFSKPVSGSLKQLYFFVPLIIVALISFSCGINTSSGMGMIAANLFLTLGIGFCEEIYFRGIICRLWLEKGEKAAVVISSSLFAVCHLMNIAGGAGITETILQICFAFIYGIVSALIFIIYSSIWPGIMLHFFHDFCSFISIKGSTSANIICGAIQFIILLLYAYSIIKRRGKSVNSV